MEVVVVMEVHQVIYQDKLMMTFNDLHHMEVLAGIMVVEAAVLLNSMLMTALFSMGSSRVTEPRVLVMVVEEGVVEVFLCGVNVFPEEEPFKLMAVMD